MIIVIRLPMKMFTMTVPKKYFMTRTKLRTMMNIAMFIVMLMVMMIMIMIKVT